MKSFLERPPHEKFIILVLSTLIALGAIAATCNFLSLNNAVAKGSIWRVKLLLTLGFDINAKAGLSGYPIDHAVHNDNKDLLELLIIHGADINSTDDDGDSILQRAIVLNKNTTARILIEQGARLNACSLYWAVRKDNKELVELLISKGIDVNAACQPPRLKIRPAQEYLHAPLYATMHKDASEVATVLIDHGAIINPQIMKSYSPLHAAASSKARKMVKLLLSRGAKVNAEDQEGHTPLYYATKTEDIEVQRILIAAGAIRK